MKIGIIGTGFVGQIIAEKLSQLNHDVMIGTRDKKKTLAKTEKDAFDRPPFFKWHKNNPKVILGTFPETAKFGEIIVNATLGNGSIDALKAAGEKNLADKILIDIANPLDFSKGMPPELTISNSDSLGERIQKAFPKTKVVKSLNTVNAYVMVNPALLGEDHNIFLSGNSKEAKEQVRKILISFGWKDKNLIDLGDITTARGTEQYIPLWSIIFMGTKNPMFNMKLVFAKSPQK